MTYAARNWTQLGSGRAANAKAMPKLPSELAQPAVKRAKNVPKRSVSIKVVIGRLQSNGDVNF